jgi:hypothetical protein
MSFDPLPTPNPNEFAVRVWASPQKVLQKMGGLVAGTTTLKAADLCVVPSSEEDLGSYLYLKPLGKREDGAMGFVFGKPKTDAEKYTPYDSYERTEEYPFFPVVEGFRATPDITKGIEQFDPGGVTVYQIPWKIRYRMREMAQGATTIEYRLYQSPTKFRLRRPVVQQPVRVPIDLPGVDDPGFHKVLIARRIKVPEAVIGPCATSWRTYNPTTPAGWARHLIDADQDQDPETGIWRMIEKYARPPRGGRTTGRRS